MNDLARRCRLWTPVVVAAAVAGCAVQLGGMTGTDPPEAPPAVTERIALMKRNDANIKFVKSASSATRQQAVGAAEEMAADAKRLRDLFPPGSERASSASSAIWSDPKRFAQQIDTYERATVRLAEAHKRNDSRGIADGITALDRQCSSCHMHFRSLF
ncbi:MAG TPA: cytochrome c [Burkholderiales bacterium]|nr:cytochrome c [Burkholderiales bacterium]